MLHCFFFIWKKKLNLLVFAGLRAFERSERDLYTKTKLIQNDNCNYFCFCKINCYGRARNEKRYVQLDNLQIYNTNSLCCLWSSFSPLYVPNDFECFELSEKEKQKCFIFFCYFSSFAIFWTFQCFSVPILLLQRQPNTSQYYITYLQTMLVLVRSWNKSYSVHIHSNHISLSKLESFVG